MNPLIKKEIRLLLPAWIAAMLLAVVPAWIWHLFWSAHAGPDAWESFNYLLSFDVPLMVAFGILCLGIASFGQEFSSNTFAVLLSQPAERRRLWTIKSNVLAIASASVWLVAMVLISWQFDSLYSVKYAHIANHEVSKWETLEFLTISALAVCTGGLWTTLLLRQIAGAFWVTLIAPVAIVFGIGTVLGFFPITDEVVNVITSVALLGYSLAGFFWARKLFFRAQDTQWTGGNVFFFWRRNSVEQTRSFIRLPRHRFFALVWKEIRLYEVNLFIAAVLLAVHLGALVLHPFVSNRNTKMVLEQVWALWLVMPLLIGSAAVAEERKMGVLEAQLCLPVFRRWQLAVKFLVGLFLSLVLGAVMPSIIEYSREVGTHWFPYWIFPVAAAIFFISIYASTLARSTLHAIGIAIALPIVVWFGSIAFCYLAFQVNILAPVTYFYRDYEGLCRVRLLMRLCLPVFPLVLAGLIFWNFKWLHQSWKLVRVNTVAVLIAFALLFALTNAIYYRPWELLETIESPHGPARLGKETSAQFSFAYHQEQMIALLPDGKLWRENINPDGGDFGTFYFEGWLPRLRTERFIGDSNWAEIAPGGLYVLGLRQNGTLWKIFQSENGVSRPALAQIGSDTDWLKIAQVRLPFNLDGFLLLKKNGTLWLWGTNDVNGMGDWSARISRKLKLDMATPPVCISSETNWTDVFSFGYSEGFAKKNDGTFWSWRTKWFPYGGYTFRLARETNLDNQWSDYAYAGDVSAEIKTNGELWLLEHPATNWTYGDWWGAIPTYTQKIELGSNYMWKAAAFGGNSRYWGYDFLILLRQDGTLWKWNFREHPSFHPVQLGHYSDWVALPGDDWIGLALAADGSIWSWSDPSDRWWLAPSRRPVYMGNILEDEGGKE